MQFEHAGHQTLLHLRHIAETHVGLALREARPRGLALRLRHAVAGEAGPVADHRARHPRLARRLFILRPAPRRPVEGAEDVGDLAGVEAMQVGRIRRRITMVE